MSNDAWNYFLGERKLVKSKDKKVKSKTIQISKIEK
jgi:hypothetical protein